MSGKIKSYGELKNIKGYELVCEEKLKDLNSLGVQFKHKKTGARVVVISNDDENKVFSIGFRTPPSDNTGVPHIIEHSVLCGSKEFPSKDPFVELVKGSLNTFLNAMTYSDKTIYPVASCNNKDFQNLMHVYLDAVFYPNIYNKEEIFRQEGWHYELNASEDEIIYNGVVYNEMKGVFSSPEQQLFRLIQQSLFPDTAYGTESGGDPSSIPELTYEQFLNFHKKYYHPSNSYIYLYGNMDIEEKLNWIDENYLDNFEEEKVDSDIKIQDPFEKNIEIKDYYSVSEDENLEDKTYLSYNFVIGTSLDKELYLAFQILEYALLAAPGAPLKQELLAKEIGKDILSSYDNGILQPVFSIIAKNTEETKKEEFINVIRNILARIVKEGIDEKSLRAAINYYEFKYREADFGQFPKGLMYGIQILDSWLYDDSKPFLHMNSNETFEFLKGRIGTGYYEKLIERYILDNHHSSVVIVKPKKGLTNELEEITRNKLREYKESLTEDEILAIIEKTEKLKTFQDTPSTKEELEKIPLLERKDITRNIQPLYNDLKEVDATTVLHHNMFTNEIGYIKLLFDLSDVSEELIPYIGLLSNVLGYMDTRNYSFSELSNEINISTGGIFTSISTYNKINEEDKYEAKFVIYSKVLYSNTEKAFELIKEMLINTKLSDYNRLKEILEETKSRLQMKMNSSGNSSAVGRAMSYFSESALFNELTSGISYYDFIEEICRDYEGIRETVVENLEKLMNIIFKKDNLMLSYTGNETGFDKFEKSLKEFFEIFDIKKAVASDNIGKNNLRKLNPVALMEGFKTSGKVQYVARAGSYKKNGYEYTGLLKVLKVILSYDYLWNNVRVKGGAYGCMCGFNYDGSGYFVSYRDPNLLETNNIYNNIPEYIEKFNVDERDMTKYIIGTISSMDTPLNPAAKGARSLAAYLCGISEDMFSEERNAILNADKEDIRGLADLIKSVLDQGYICVIGNENKVEADKSLFKKIRFLLND